MITAKLSKNIKNILCTALALLLFCAPFLPFAAQNAFAQEQEAASQTPQAEHKRILYISSYSYDWESVPYKIEGAKEVINLTARLETVFMNTKRLPLADAFAKTHELIKTYLSQGSRYDAVIASDDDALNFALEYKSELFAGVPIIFEGINSQSKAEAAAKENGIAGVAERFPIEETITLALTLNPAAQRVAAISDLTESGIGSIDQFYACEDKFPSLNFSDINASRLTNEQLLQEVSELDNDTILLFFMRTNDVQGNVYSMEESIEDVTSAAKIPVFKADEGGIGTNGLIGGAVISRTDMGRMAGQMALDAANGKEVDGIYTMPVYYLFDENVLAKFGYTKRDLPHGAVILNEKLNFIEQHPQMTAIIALAVVLGGMIIIFLMVSNRNKQKYANELKAGRDTLETAIEQSRMTYCEYDLEKNKLIFGEKAQRLHGLPPECDNIPEGFFDTGRLMPQYYDAFAQLIDAMRAGDDAAVADMQMYNTVQRAFVWVRVRFALIKNEDGTVVMAMGTAADITEEKRAEKRYEQAQALGDLLDSAALASAHIDLTKNIVLATDKNEGETFSQLDKSSADEFLSECLKYIDPAGEDEKLAHMLTRADMAADFTDGVTQMEAQYKVQGIPGASGFRRATVRLTKNPATASIEAFLYIRDITPEVLERLALQKAAAPDINFVSVLTLKNNDVHCVYMRKNSGFTPPAVNDYSTAVNQFVYDIVSPEDTELASRYMQRSAILQALAKDGLYTFTVRINADGTAVAKKYELSYLDAEKTAVLFLCRDVPETENK